MANASNSYYTPSVDELPFKFSVASPVADRTRILPPQLHFLLGSGILLVSNSGSPATVANSSDCSLSFFASSSPSSGCRRGVSDPQNRLIGSISITLKVAPFDQEVSIHHTIRATKASEETPTRARVCGLDTWRHMYKNAARNASVLKIGSIFFNAWQLHTYDHISSAYGNAYSMANVWIPRPSLILPRNSACIPCFVRLCITCNGRKTHSFSSVILFGAVLTDEQ